MSNADKILIGKISAAVGLKGEVKIYSYSEEADRFERVSRIFIDDKEFKILSVRYKDISPILKLDSIDDRNKSEALKGKDIYVSEGDLEDLPEGVYYIKDIIGMDVLSESGEKLGLLFDVKTNTAQKLYVVKREGKSDILIPGVEEFIKKIDIENRQIIVKVIEGLYED